VRTTSSERANVEAAAARDADMDCPECGERLTDYHLGDRDAVGCEHCGYVGIDVEHRSRPSERESWDDALERFHRRHGGEERTSDDAKTPSDERIDVDERPGAVTGGGATRATDEQAGTARDGEHANRSADEGRTERSAAVNGSLGSGSKEDADEG
jgi:hypothetical protein